MSSQIQVYYPQIAYYLLAALVAALTAIGIMQKSHKAKVARIEQGAVDKVWDGLRRSFIRDMATNHLPHIQMCLEMISKKLDIDLPEPPPIRYMPQDSRDKE